VNWGASPNAVRYAISIATDGGPSLTLTRDGHARSLTLTNIGAGAVTVSVAGIGPLGEHGPTAQTKVRGAELPGPVTGITIHRHRKTVVIHWHPAAHASGYAVRLTIGGHQTAGIAQSPTITLTGLAARTQVSLSITAMSADHRSGPTAVKRLVAPH
jgi:hypothetical protein